MPLTDLTIRNTKPEKKPIKLFDSGGLFLLAKANGARLWRLKYRFGGKEKLLSFGSYPEVSLKKARDKRDKAREELADGLDPSQLRKTNQLISEQQAANSFEVVQLILHLIHFRDIKITLQ